MEELNSIFSDLSSFIKSEITVKLDDKTTLTINQFIDTKVSVITEEETSTILFEKFSLRYPRYSRPPQTSALNISELSEFYHKLEPYKEVLEDKIEESFRKEIELDRLVKKEN